MKTAQALNKSIRRWLVVFIVLLVLSGITAFPLETELSLLADITKSGPIVLRRWIDSVYTAVSETNTKYPFMAYGTDWLAFAHIVIAVAFIGPLKDPVRNVWIIQFGMIACIMVIPLALICGSIRNIPIFWQIIDCSFGVIGLIPLNHCYRNIIKLEQITHTKNK
ncbi:MAG TPA: hypothetical protein PKD91_03585 [Bacteroidia bacterium]|nr:hypothetical protein [Bacteroidia bacterium]